MRIHIYFHHQGKVWAINQAVNRVVFGGEAKGLQERDVTKKNLWDICAEKARDGYEKFGELDIAEDAFQDAVWIVREMYHRGISQVLDFTKESEYRPIFEALAKGMVTTAMNANVVVQAQDWLADNLTTADAIVPMAPITLASGRGCYF